MCMCVRTHTCMCASAHTDTFTYTHTHPKRLLKSRGKGGYCSWFPALRNSPPTHPPPRSCISGGFLSPPVYNLMSTRARGPDTHTHTLTHAHTLFRKPTTHT